MFSLVRLVALAVTLAHLPLLIAACGGDHAALERRSDRMATQPSGGTSLLRPLTWGDVVIVATTDIHGWYQGHLKASQPEPNYSGDWGDFASFVTHVRAKALLRGVDLLVVDSGDLHDGAGLSDGYPAGQGPDAHVSNQFHSLVDFDVLAVGNHELYVYENALDTYKNFVPAQHGRYLASNVNITLPQSSAPGAKNVSVPMGERVVKFRTPLHKRKVTSLGVLFDFTGADAGLTVQNPSDMVKEAWFKQAIQDPPDFFLLVGHMPVRRDQWPEVIAPIRALHPTTPILIAGGHTHIRDAVKYDDNAVGIESGRYLETIGWLAANLTDTGKTSFSRSYIDANRRNYAFHAGLSSPKFGFDTPKGVLITAKMGKVARDWNLTQVYGNAPQDYYLDRVAPSSESSLLNLLSNKVLPTVVSTSNPSRASTPNFVIANSGSQRFDVYKGPFTKNDQYIVSPFKDAFLYIKDVPYQYASQIIHKLNRDPVAGAASKREADVNVASSSSSAPPRSADADVHRIFDDWGKKQHELAQADLARLDQRAAERRADSPTLGYVTHDDLGNDGDDTVHTALPFASSPDYVASPLTGNATAAMPDTLVDVILVDFILSSVVRILNSLQTAKKYANSDATAYNSLTTQDLYPLYAQKAWQ
ncbi:5' nucleotidase [Ceraceosorus bombacis]|uniref:5' nucleotidase n=1 Tax=Ceraceosorus bombacis TaxID=401625 RepID=A0A0P1BGE9_9BASI|nr:5' nucleotidase [Ceraceosorus bombacis]